MKSLFFLLICLVLGIVYFSSCSDNRIAYRDDQKWIEKEITFDSIESQATNNKNFYLEDLIYRNKKVLVYIDGNCGKCVSELTYWQNFMQEFSNDTTIGFVYIISSDNIFQTVYNLKRSNFNAPLFYDKNGLFFSTNQFSYDKNFQSMILNKSNEVIFIGSPLLHPKFEKKIRKILHS
jgi:hypothetical protein